MSEAAVVLNSIRPRSLETSVELTTKGAMDEVVEPYAMLFFDHLYSEYLTLQEKIKEAGTRQLLDGIYQRRLDCILTWSNIYTFDLVLVDFRSPEDLIRKAYDARNRYRSVAGQKEYDEYQASKPPDLAAIRIAPNENPPQPEEIIERTIRADIKYLLNKIYMYYALLPMREKLRDKLTAKARKMTYFFVGLVTLIILFNVGGLLLTTYGSKYANFSVMFGLTVATVALAGVLGGCVSMLQRIQSAPSEGDALFNLASLTNGWVGLSTSPLYGAIFASLLFVLFSAGILKGSIFPEINTPGAKPASAAVASEAKRVQTTSTPDQKESTDISAAQPAPGTADVDKSAQSNLSGTVLQIKDFLRETGPTNGVSYGLLIIWSFIAGFAERLVPDTLNRMVAKNEAIQGTKS
jgi:hypothetical protein